jgi:predicted signal transduction protein with EAL and GGDEF domain
MRGATLVARIGGDEFAVILPRRASSAAMAARAVDALARPFRAEGASFLVGASAGGAAFPTDGITSEEIVRHADTAMRRAKSSGGGRSSFIALRWKPEWTDEGSWSAICGMPWRRAACTWPTSRSAIRGGQAWSASRPCFAGTTQRSATSPPSDFIPVAEESGLIVHLGAWVLERACREAASWPSPARIAVNMSPPQLLQPDPAHRVDAILARTGLTPQRLDLEVTEGIAIVEPETVAATFRPLRQRGIGISLDDFGTGHSNLGYISRFRFDKAKIDRSFVQGMGEDGHYLALVRAVMALGRSLGLDIVAEGVETPSQLEALRRLRCGFVQGYLLGKPMSPENARRLLEDGTRLPLGREH